MDRQIQDMLGEMLDFSISHEYMFAERCGLTFIFRKDTTLINRQAASIEILPVGIIYEENGEYYYAPLHRGDEIDEIVKEYVKNI